MSVQQSHPTQELHKNMMSNLYSNLQKHDAHYMNSENGELNFIHSAIPAPVAAAASAVATFSTDTFHHSEARSSQCQNYPADGDTDSHFVERNTNQNQQQQQPTEGFISRKSHSKRTTTSSNNDGYHQIALSSDILTKCAFSQQKLTIDTSSSTHSRVLECEKCEICSTQSRVAFRDAWRAQLQERLYTRYSSSQNYYYTRDINEILSGARSSAVIAFFDYLTFDDDCGEFLKREYEIHEYPKKAQLLSEYYKYHKDIPRLFILPETIILNAYHDKKRRIDYYQIAQLIDEENQQNPERPPKGIVGDKPQLHTDESEVPSQDDDDDDDDEDYSDGNREQKQGNNGNSENQLRKRRRKRNKGDPHSELLGDISSFINRGSEQFHPKNAPAILLQDDEEGGSDDDQPEFALGDDDDEVVFNEQLELEIMSNMMMNAASSSDVKRVPQITPTTNSTSSGGFIRDSQIDQKHLSEWQKKSKLWEKIREKQNLKQRGTRETATIVTSESPANRLHTQKNNNKNRYHEGVVDSVIVDENYTIHELNSKLEAIVGSQVSKQQQQLQLQELNGVIVSTASTASAAGRPQFDAGQLDNFLRFLRGNEQQSQLEQKSQQQQQGQISLFQSNNSSSRNTQSGKYVSGVSTVGVNPINRNTAQQNILESKQSPRSFQTNQQEIAAGTAITAELLSRKLSQGNSHSSSQSKFNSLPKQQQQQQHQQVQLHTLQHQQISFKKDLNAQQYQSTASSTSPLVSSIEGGFFTQKASNAQFTCMSSRGEDTARGLTTSTMTNAGGATKEQQLSKKKSNHNQIGLQQQQQLNRGSNNNTTNQNNNTYQSTMPFPIQQSSYLTLETVPSSTTIATKGKIERTTQPTTTVRLNTYGLCTAATLHTHTSQKLDTKESQQPTNTPRSPVAQPMHISSNLSTNANYNSNNNNKNKHQQLPQQNVPIASAHSKQPSSIENKKPTSPPYSIYNNQKVAPQQKQHLRSKGSLQLSSPRENNTQFSDSLQSQQQQFEQISMKNSILQMLVGQQQKPSEQSNAINSSTKSNWQQEKSNSQQSSLSQAAAPSSNAFLKKKHSTPSTFQQHSTAVPTCTSHQTQQSQSPNGMNTASSGSAVNTLPTKFSSSPYLANANLKLRLDKLNYSKDNNNNNTTKQAAALAPQTNVMLLQSSSGTAIQSPTSNNNLPLSYRSSSGKNVDLATPKYSFYEMFQSQLANAQGAPATSRDKHTPTMLSLQKNTASQIHSSQSGSVCSPISTSSPQAPVLFTSLTARNSNNSNLRLEFQGNSAASQTGFLSSRKTHHTGIEIQPKQVLNKPNQQLNSISQQNQQNQQQQQQKQQVPILASSDWWQSQLSQQHSHSPSTGSSPKQQNTSTINSAREYPQSQNVSPLLLTLEPFSSKKSQQQTHNTLMQYSKAQTVSSKQHQNSVKVVLNPTIKENNNSNTNSIKQSLHKHTKSENCQPLGYFEAASTSSHTHHQEVHPKISNQQQAKQAANNTHNPAGITPTVTASAVQKVISKLSFGNNVMNQLSATSTVRTSPQISPRTSTASKTTQQHQIVPIIQLPLHNSQQSTLLGNQVPQGTVAHSRQKSSSSTSASNSLLYQQQQSSTQPLSSKNTTTISLNGQPLSQDQDYFRSVNSSNLNSNVYPQLIINNNNNNHTNQSQQQLQQPYLQQQLPKKKNQKMVSLMTSAEYSDVHRQQNLLASASSSLSQTNSSLITAGITSKSAAHGGPSNEINSNKYQGHGTTSTSIVQKTKKKSMF